MSASPRPSTPATAPKAAKGLPARLSRLAAAQSDLTTAHERQLSRLNTPKKWLF